jgi:hypothetical protein
MIARIVLISVWLVSLAQSSPVDETMSTTTETKLESDYYSDFDADYARRFQDLRTTRNWINLYIIAVSMIVSLLLLIVIIHLRTKKKSGIISLM